MIVNGNSLEVLKTLEENSVDAVVTDPPYGLSFMGKAWDYDVPTVELWREVFRVLKPGGHLLAFAGTRTQHRMAVKIEDAGFEIRDMIAWVYGSGFPKSLDVSKAIDKAAGAERTKLMVPTKPGNHPDQGGNIALGATGMTDISKPTTEEAKQWEGWGTALKPALEPITVARKPFKGSVAQNVLKYGTGGLNIDGVRVRTDELTPRRNNNTTTVYEKGFEGTPLTINPSPLGRFPANLIHDGSDEITTPLNDAARFFYCAKASRAERNKGLGGFEEKEGAGSYQFRASGSLDGKPTQPKANVHPTVKPVKLMQYLVRLVTPPGGTVLDPFNGSGTTGIACKLEGFDYVGIELDPEYCRISEARIDAWVKEETAEERQLNLV